MPSYQVNDGSENYGRNGSYNNYGYGQDVNGGVPMTIERDKPPAYNGNDLYLLYFLSFFEACLVKTTTSIR